MHVRMLSVKSYELSQIAGMGWFLFPFIQGIYPKGVDEAPTKDIQYR
jgi:hypothetical protein